MVFVDDSVIVQQVYIIVVFDYVFGDMIIVDFVDFGDVEDFQDFGVIDEFFVFFWCQYIFYCVVNIVDYVIDDRVVVDFYVFLFGQILCLFVCMDIECEDWRI